MARSRVDLARLNCQAANELLLFSASTSRIYTEKTRPTKCRLRWFQLNRNEFDAFIRLLYLETPVL